VVTLAKQQSAIDIVSAFWTLMIELKHLKFQQGFCVVGSG
jgi:hypothetical protein